ncbi:hypothetical protein AB0M22_45575 [Nocardia sp. NPDC051756]|uniref:hypothetical protein n=1 Tax=Nocardia sp. NPDC051756 TaxID=3154751 RepID=UPI003444B96B
MTSRRILTATLAVVALALISPAAAHGQEDNAARNKAFTKCLEKEVTAAQEQMGLNDKELKTFIKIINGQFSGNPPKDFTEEEQAKNFSEIQDTARKALPQLKGEKIAEMVQTLKAKARHCVPATSKG